MKPHIIEQDRDGMIFNIDYVYLVRQTQTTENFFNTTIYVCTDEDEAIRRARELNKTYGSGCEFDDDWEMIEITDDDYHYYDVEPIKLNEKFYG